MHSDFYNIVTIYLADMRTTFMAHGIYFACRSLQVLFREAVVVVFLNIVVLMILTLTQWTILLFRIFFLRGH